MPDLPNEILCHIVELVDCLKTLWVLLTVSHQMSVFAITSMYRELSFDSRYPPGADFRPSLHAKALEKLARSAKSNPNLRFTTSFSVFRFISPQPESESIEAILPFLVNLRRLSITMPFVDPEMLWTLPRSVQLTHLIVEDTIYSDTFVQFIESHPKLELISIDAYNFTAVNHRPVSHITLPILRSLACPLRIASLFRNRSSITDLRLLNAFGENRDSPIPEELINETVDAFPSARAVYFQDPIHFPSVALLTCMLPNIEYLRLDEVYTVFVQNWHLLATSKLKYIRLGGMVTMIHPIEVARKAFRAIKSLVIIDMGQSKPLRYHRASEVGVPVDIHTLQWQPWRENVHTDM